MAKNTGEDYRKGAVKNRSQFYNEKTDCYIKRDSETGQFISAKKGAYKGISLEK